MRNTVEVQLILRKQSFQKYPYKKKENREWRADKSFPENCPLKLGNGLTGNVNHFHIEI